MVHDNFYFFCLDKGDILHNRFDVTVVDAKTGKVKQTAVGFNVITDSFFKYKFHMLTFGAGTSGDGDYGELLRIGYGSGSGTPSISDTALFTRISEKEATTIETVFEYPTSHITRQIKIEANESNGKTITEVGFTGYPWANLLTHAMLQDSEGNQIAIAKTDTDVIYITATFYATVIPSGFGTNGIYPVNASDNDLFKWLLVNTYCYINTVAITRHQCGDSYELKTANTGSKSISSYDGGTGNITALTYQLPLCTFLDSQCNNRIVKHIGLPGVGAFTFPNHTVFPPYAVNNIVIGSGDGTTTDFNIKAPLIQAGSVHVYVDSVEKTEGTDYTVDLESNCGDWYENYHTAGFTARDDNVEFGNYKERPNYVGNYYLFYDPLVWWKCGELNKYPSSCSITAEKPIWIDFISAKECNRLKIEINTVPAAQIDNLVIEYSSDNENWTAISYTRTGQVWSWTAVSARYWRVYIPNYTWSYASAESSNDARDGQTFRPTFFLGKTVPGLKFTTAPAAGTTITASYSLEYPFKTENNLLKFTCTIQFQRG